MAEDDFADIDVDAPTVEVIRANDAEIQRLTAKLAQGGPDDHQERLAVELVNVAKRQEGVLSEVRGLEDRARQIGEVRAGIEAHYGL